MFARKHLAFQDLQRQRILYEPLDRAPQWPRSVCWVVALAEQQRLSRGREFERDLPLCKQSFDALEKQAHNSAELLLPQRIENHNFINAINELRPERGAQRFHRFLPRALRIL